MSNSITPSQTIQIDNNMFTLDGDSNSIIVINTPPVTQAQASLLSEKLEKNTIATSTQNLMNESNGYLKQIENELARVKQQLEEVSQENVLIKEHNRYLASKLEKQHKISTAEDDDDADSIVAYVDVQNIANKLEYYLDETNKLFKSSEDCANSMQFFVKNVWSLIAHEHNEKNLDQFKQVKDELIQKLSKLDLDKKSQINMVLSFEKNFVYFIF